MTVNEFVEVATALGWRVQRKHNVYLGMPFCRPEIIERTCLQFYNAKTGDFKNAWIYSPLEGRQYKKRYLTEIRKINEKAFALLPEAKECQGLVEVLRYCS